MIISEGNAQALYNAVIGLMVKRKAHAIHYPDDDCFKGECTWRKSVSKTCDWKPLLHLVVAFWKDAPNVTESWKAAARRRGFDADELHDVLLAVFIGGDHVNPSPYTDSIGWAYASTAIKDLAETAKDVYIDGVRVDDP